MLAAVSSDSRIVSLPEQNNPEASINYISHQEDLLLVSWVADLRYKKASWGLARGKFYFDAFEMLGDGDRVSPTFGSFRQLAIYLHENHKIASVSRAYELRRAYMVYLQVLDLKSDIPVQLPFTTEILLELEKVKDEHFQEAVQWCIDTCKETGELKAAGFLALLQEHYPDIDWLRRKPRESSGSSTQKAPKKNLAELQEALQQQRQQIDDQRSQLEQLSTNHQTLEQELTATARERDALRQQNEALARRVQELELLLSSSTEEPPLIKEETKSEPLIFSSFIEKILNRKRQEGVEVKIVPECGDWILYDQDDKIVGGVEEGDEQALEKAINVLVPRSITELLQGETEITCTADAKTGFYLLKRPDIDPEKPEEPEAFTSASIVVAQIHRILTRSTTGDRSSWRSQWD